MQLIVEKYYVKRIKKSFLKLYQFNFKKHYFSQSI